MILITEFGDNFMPKFFLVSFRPFLKLRGTHADPPGALV
jgi:hypothetical protein